MNKFAKGHYTIVNPDKYLGVGKPLYRSSWELGFMRFCDSHPSVIKWASESIKIPYRNPLTNKNTVYVPDFFVVYVDKNNKQHAELIEIKPGSQVSLESAGRSTRNQAQAIINAAKWEAANAYCRQKGIKFRVITEHDIFHGTKRSKR